MMLPAGEAMAVAGAGSLLVSDALPLLVPLAVGKGKVSLSCWFLLMGTARHVRQGPPCCVWRPCYDQGTSDVDLSDQGALCLQRAFLR